MIEKLTSSRYQISVAQSGKWITSVITDLQTGKSREFKQCWGTLEGVTNHMNSLTDFLMKEEFFKEAKKKK